MSFTHFVELHFNHGSEEIEDMSNTGPVPYINAVSVCISSSSVIHPHPHPHPQEEPSKKKEQQRQMMQESGSHVNDSGMYV